ncbi:hypothetical protein SG34_033695 [Thalassomonas viridans]|uniref:Uncharacterized protein n=1 Tax=Thalassomonas viridans TaxID=137584 RepID=A0AAF0CD43_9GAMM|nr:hypothetical protein [Thalassomonas viridans]WDE08848.1 hypothetical protein SG34_033695 [Thalassomonas viridans]
MEDGAILTREDNLASWRIATLLTFNGFLIAGVFADNPNPFLQYYGPYIGILISLSVFFVAVVAHIRMWELHKSWGKPSPVSKSNNPYRFIFFNLFGPYLFSPVLFLWFWGLYLCWRL